MSNLFSAVVTHPATFKNLEVSGEYVFGYSALDVQGSTSGVCSALLLLLEELSSFLLDELSIFDVLDSSSAAAVVDSLQAAKNDSAATKKKE